MGITLTMRERAFLRDAIARAAFGVKPGEVIPMQRGGRRPLQTHEEMVAEVDSAIAEYEMIVSGVRGRNFFHKATAAVA